MKRSALWIILLIAFVDLAAFGLIIPLQAVYAERMGATGLTFGLLIGVYSFMQIIFNPILGRWSDRVGRRRVLLISIAGSVISHTLLGVADLSNSLTLLFVARILDGITGANIATAQAYIADVTTKENRAKGMGMFGAAFGVGFVVGPAIGALLSYIGRHVSGVEYGTAWPAFGATFVSMLALFLVWRYLPEPEKSIEPSESRFKATLFDQLRSVFLRNQLRQLFLLVFGVTFAFVLLETTFVYLCQYRFDMTEVGIGLIFAYIGMMMVIVQGGMIGRLVRKFGEAKLVATGPFITAIGFLILSGIPLFSDISIAWTLLIVGCIPVALGNGITGPNLNALISHQAQSGRQGATLGSSQGVGSLARTIAPPLGGLLYDFRESLPYWVGAAMLVVLGFFAISIVHTYQTTKTTDTLHPESTDTSTSTQAVT